MLLTVYTALTDNNDHRDGLQKPELVTHGVRYVCMSNSYHNIWPWEIVSIPYKNDDPVRVARWCKTQGYKSLNCDYSIWMDATYCPRYDMWAIIYRHLLDCCIATFPHFERDCIYDEAIAVLADNLDNPMVIDRQLRMFKDDNYPSHNGLADTSIVARRHSKTVDKFCDLWWSIINSGSRRDQLSFNYALWKMKILSGILRPGVTRKRGAVYETFQPYFSALFHRPKAWKSSL